MLSLLQSRKFWLVIAGTIVVLANKFLKWELTDAEVYPILALIAANVFGIAIEDAGEKSAPPPVE